MVARLTAKLGACGSFNTRGRSFMATAILPPAKVPDAAKERRGLLPQRGEFRSASFRVREAQTKCKERRLCSIGDVELAQDGAHVIAHGAFGDVQMFGD